MLSAYVKKLLYSRDFQETCILDYSYYCLPVTQSCLTLWSHRLQHARLICLPLFPWVCSNSYPLSWWCHPTSSSFAPPPPTILLLPSKCSTKYWLTLSWGSPGRSGLVGTLGRFLQTLASLFLPRLWSQSSDALCFIIKSSVTWTSTIKADWRVSLCHHRQRVLGVAWSSAPGVQGAQPTG